MSLKNNIRTLLKEDIEKLKSRRFALSKRVPVNSSPALLNHVKKECSYIDAILTDMKAREEKLDKLFWKYQNKIILNNQAIEAGIDTRKHTLEMKAENKILKQIVKDLA